MVGRQALFVVFFSVLSTAGLLAGGLAYVQSTKVLDFEAARYGFPYWWIERVLVTFAGRTDFLHVETSGLIKNITIYFLASLCFWLALVLVRQRRTVGVRERLNL
jgi:hypothetical protein